MHGILWVLLNPHFQEFMKDRVLAIIGAVILLATIAFAHRLPEEWRIWSYLIAFAFLIFGIIYPQVVKRRRVKAERLLAEMRNAELPPRKFPTEMEVLGRFK